MKKLVLFLQAEQLGLNRGLNLENRVTAVISQQSNVSEFASSSAVSDKFELLNDKKLAEVLEHLSKDIQESKIRSILVIPGEDILKCELKVPAKQFRQIQKALPYLVEDQIASDPEDCFIAVGERKGDLLSCAIIEKEVITQHYHFLNNEQLNAEKIVSDDSLILASAPCLHVFENRVLMATAQGTTFAFDIALLNIYLEKFVPVDSILRDGEDTELLSDEVEDQITSSDLVENALKKETLTVFFYKQGDKNLDDLKQQLNRLLDSHKKSHGFDYEIHTIEKTTEEYYLETAAKLLDRQNATQAINLLQGEYKVKRVGSVLNIDVNWKPVALLILAFVFLHLIAVFVETLRYEQASEEADIKTKMVFEEIFPKTKNYTRMKERVSSLIKGSVAPSDNQFLKLIFLFSEAMQSINSTNPESLKPSQIQYEQNSAELKIDMVARDFDTLNTLKETAESAGLILEISSTSTEKDGVKGRLKVKLIP